MKQPVSNSPEVYPHPNVSEFYPHQSAPILMYQMKISEMAPRRDCQINIARISVRNFMKKIEQFSRKRKIYPKWPSN